MKAYRNIIVLVAVLLLGGVRAAQFALADAQSRSVYNLDIDTATYDGLARQLADTWDSRVIPPTQPPGFVALLAVIYSLFGPSYLAVKLTFSALLVATASLTASILWRRGHQLEATLAAGLIVSSPLLVAYAATLQYEIPAAFMVSLVLAVLLTPARFIPAGEVLWAAGLGVLCGASALLREVLALLLPISLVFALQRWRLTRMSRTLIGAGALALIFTFCATVGAWSYVQHRNTGQVVWISNKSDINLRIGNNPNANGTFNLQLVGVAEPSGFSFVSQHPAETVRLAGRKLLYFFGFLREPWTVPNSGAIVLSRLTLGSLPLHTAEKTVAGVIVALFLAGVFLSRRDLPLWPVAGVILASAAVAMVYFGSQRFAVPVQPAIYVFVGISAGSILRKLLATQRLRVVCAGLVLLVIATQFVGAASVYSAEAETLEGIAAINVEDDAASGHAARLAAAAAGERPAAFLTSVMLPAGAFGVQVRARVADCSDQARTALSIDVRDEWRVSRYRQSFTNGELCKGPGYQNVTVIGTLRRQEVMSIFVNTPGTQDLWIDRIDVPVGFKRRLDVPIQ